MVSRAKGMKSNVILMKQAFRNALIPIVTPAGLTVTTLVGSAIVTEQLFGWPEMKGLIYGTIDISRYIEYVNKRIKAGTDINCPPGSIIEKYNGIYENPIQLFHIDKSYDIISFCISLLLLKQQKGVAFMGKDLKGMDGTLWLPGVLKGGWILKHYR